MTQSKKMSLLETLTSTVIGYTIAVSAQVVIFPFFDIHVPLHDNLMIGALFTIVSVVRGYFVRRLFNMYEPFKRRRLLKKLLKEMPDGVQPSSS